MSIFKRIWGDGLPLRVAVVQVVGLAWPVVIEQLLGMAVMLINTYIVGHLGADALAAMGLSSQIYYLLIGLFSALGVGSTALVARHIGAGEPQEANRIAGQSILIAVVLGCVVALPLLLGRRFFLQWVGGSPEVVDIGTGYLLAVATVQPLAALLLVGNAILRGVGDTRTPMLIMGLVNVINATVSASFVYGLGPLPEMGFAGAGIGVACGVGVGGVLVALSLCRGHQRSGIHLRLSTVRLDRKRAWRLLRLGLPSAGEQVVMRAAQMGMAVVVTRLGTAAYAGHQLAIQLLSVAFMPGLALSTAATTLVGLELGRDAPQRAKACVYAASGIATSMMCLVGVLAYVFAQPILRIFTSDGEVIAQGVHAVRGCAIMQLPLSLYFVFSGALRGAGDTRYVFLAQSAPIWLVRMTLAPYLGLTQGLGLGGIWAAMVLDVFCRAGLLIARFRGGAWQHVEV
jgi:putative MATE family efflux protein